LTAITEEEALREPEVVKRTEELKVSSARDLFWTLASETSLSSKSWDWTYGQTPEFTNTIDHCFSWGSIVSFGDFGRR